MATDCKSKVLQEVTKMLYEHVSSISYILVARPSFICL